MSSISERYPNADHTVLLHGVDPCAERIWTIIYAKVLVKVTFVDIMVS